jgi:chromosome segregation protein
MKIKRVDILGFKSFVDKVSLDFQQPITGVVGPNGCGKSNIVDAIRWAMGEQNARNLRGRAMDDIIFGGSESRRPHGMAEVSIIFDNSDKICPEAYRDYAEIMVTRRLFRNGDSEYLLNKTPCRLLDISELFMDTGIGARAYSIIEQGKIGALVSARPEERRALIEEAAGITKFKVRKKSAERKMDATRQNLVRLGDVIAEVRRQTGSLKRQAQQAEKFRELRAEAKRIDICMAGNRFRVQQQELSAVQQRLNSQEQTLAASEVRLADGELSFETKRLQLVEVETRLSRLQEQDYALGGEVQRVEGGILLARRQCEDLQEQAGSLEDERAQVLSRLARLEEEHVVLEGRDQQLGDEFSVSEAAVAEAQDILQHSQQDEQQLIARLAKLRAEQMQLLSQAARFSHRQEEIVRQLASQQTRRQRYEHDVETLNVSLKDVDAKLLGLQQTGEKLRTQRETCQEQRELLQERLHQLKGQGMDAEVELQGSRQACDRARSRLESLEDLERNLDGYTEGVQALFTACPQLPRQVMADFLRVDPDHESLVELALAERLQAVPVPLTQAEGLLHELHLHGARALLALPVKLPEIALPPFGQALRELVSPVAGAEAFIDAALAGCVLVDDVADYFAQTLPVGCLLVDKSGRCLGWRGELSGGTLSMAGAGLLRKKREMTELRQQLVGLTDDLARCEKKVDQLAQQREDVQIELQELEQLLQQLDLEQLHQQKDSERLSAERQRLQERLELLDFEAQQLGEEQQLLQQEQSEIQQQQQEQQLIQQRLHEQEAELQQQLLSIRQVLEVKREELTLHKVRLAECRQQREAGLLARQRLKQNIKEQLERQQQLEKRALDGSRRSADLAREQEKLSIELDLLLRRREESQLKIRRLRESFDADRDRLDEQREGLRQIRELVEQQRRDISQHQLRQQELVVETEHLLEMVAEKFDVDLTEHQVAEADEVELQRLQLQLRDLQQRISALGEVNLTAIEEYRELETRYDFLVAQRDDLNQSLDDLQKAIGKMNRTTRRRFKETFELVNAQFKQVFPRLFRGGQAELRLTDENDLLETGVEIIVQPPGKKLQSVNLLSGGEKALTAVAIIFSLFLIKPTPFCMLDEVDAPLDDANIDRFAEMVAEMSKKSQFIIITHSKRTMAAADIMHGITMQEPGVSKLVSVRVSDYQREEPVAPVLA